MARFKFIAILMTFLIEKSVQELLLAKTQAETKPMLSSIFNKALQKARFHHGSSSYHLKESKMLCLLNTFLKSAIHLEK